MRFLLVLVLVPGIAFSEDNTKSAESLTWKHNAEASVLLTSGNTQTTTLGGAFGSEYKGGPWAAKGKIGYLQNSQAGVTKAELFTIDGRGDRQIDPALLAFLQVGFLRNIFAGFNSRTSTDAGLNYAFLKNDEHTLSLEAGVGVIAENRSDIGANTFGSARATAAYAWKFSPTADFSTQFSFLDNLKTMADWRLSSVTALSVAMTSVLSTKLSFRLDYLNTPVVGKLNLDTATTVALVANF